MGNITENKCMKCGSYHEDDVCCSPPALPVTCAECDRPIHRCMCAFRVGVLPEFSPRESILREAIEHVTKNRQETHGNPEQSFSDIAHLWSWYKGVTFTPTEVAMMQALLKIARQKTTPGHGDNYVDLAGYASCAGEMAQLQPK